MRKGLVYLLMTVFLLFVAENRQSLDFQQDYGNQNFSLHLFSFAKKHRLHQSVEKMSFQQINDSLDTPEENNQNDFDANSLNTVIAITVLGLGYFLHHYFQRKKQVFHESYNLHFPSRRFILLRNIRI